MSNKSTVNQEERIITPLEAFDRWKSHLSQQSDLTRSHLAISVGTQQIETDRAIIKLGIFKGGSPINPDAEEIVITAKTFKAAPHQDQTDAFEATGDEAQLRVADIKEEGSTTITSMNHLLMETTLEMSTSMRAEAIEVNVKFSGLASHREDWTLVLPLTEELTYSTLGCVDVSETNGNAESQALLGSTGEATVRLENCRQIALNCPGCTITKYCRTDQPIFSSCNGCYITCTEC